jgi:hypothetical protein
MMPVSEETLIIRNMKVGQKVKIGEYSQVKMRRLYTKAYNHMKKNKNTLFKTMKLHNELFIERFQ